MVMIMILEEKSIFIFISLFPVRNGNQIIIQNLLIRDVKMEKTANYAME